MSTLGDRISLTWRYGKGVFLIGAVYNLVCAGFQSGGFSYAFLVDSFIIKAVIIAITLYLVLLSEAPFYILDEPFTQVDPVNINEVKSLIRERSKDHGIIITDHNYEAISSVADNLFVIADGYTDPVHCREDLVRHGYLTI